LGSLAKAPERLRPFGIAQQFLVRKSGYRGGFHLAFGNTKPLHGGSNAITLGADDRMVAGEWAHRAPVG